MLSELLRGGDERVDGEEELFDLWKDDALIIRPHLQTVLKMMH